MTVSIDIKMDPRIDLKARRTMDGNILVLDHEDIDIVLMTEKKKCVAFPKDNFSDRVYDTQDRMFKHLARRGVINRSSVRGGNVFGSLEAEMLESVVPGVDASQAFLFALHEYIKEERPYFKVSDKYDDDRLDHLLAPSPEDSTDLGDVPQKSSKGSMTKQIGPYGFQYNYSLVREGSESEDT
jgi:hypothetical protein